ncbi:MAG: hypothetical protein AB1898_01065 [Acidobacteriota bacterium]
MFAGHAGIALVFGRARRQVNVGVFIFSALLLDVVLWLFVLVGWESVTIPANYSSTHQPEFVFPHSHGLLTGVIWSAALALAVYFWNTRSQLRLGAAVWVGLAVFSHWPLDFLVHVPELPLVGATSPKVGLGLWQNMPVALGIEALLVVAGIGLYWPDSNLSRARKLGLSALLLIVLGSTIIGMTVAPPPPSAVAMAGTSLVTILAVCSLAWWLGRPST